MQVVEFFCEVRTTCNRDGTIIHVEHGDLLFNGKTLAVGADEVKEIQRRVHRCNAASDRTNIVVATQECLSFVGDDLVRLRGATIKSKATDRMDEESLLGYPRPAEAPDNAFQRLEFQRVRLG